MTKLKVSGYFKTEPGTDKNSCVFDNLEIIIPHTNYQFFQRDAMRLLPIALLNDKRYKEKRYEGYSRLDVDGESEIEGKPICVGKNVKEMSWEELQDLSCLYSIREVRLFKSVSLREAREDAYRLYNERVLKKRVFKYEAQVLRYQEDERQRGERQHADPMEVNERIAKVVENSYNMTVYPDNPEKSYSFAKQPAIIIPDPDKKGDQVPAQGGSNVVGSSSQNTDKDLP